MFRLLKALPLTLAIAALSLFTSCGSGNNTQIRIFNAIPDAQGTLDVYLNGTGNKITGSTPIQFGTIFPLTNSSSAAYASEPEGSDTITAYVSGTTLNPVNNGTFNYSSSTQYTVILQGFARANNTPDVLTDNNTAPTTNTLEYRVINSSPSSPSVGVDVYIFPTTSQQPASPQIPALTFEQAVYVQSLPYTATSGYTIVVTPHESTTPIIDVTETPANGSITTLVIVDVAGGGSVSQFPIPITDLQ
ncbi:MAG: DUF4397 domain-containing protein [Terriglobales bacterium]